MNKGPVKIFDSKDIRVKTNSEAIIEPHCLRSPHCPHKAKEKQLPLTPQQSRNTSSSRPKDEINFRTEADVNDGRNVTLNSPRSSERETTTFPDTPAIRSSSSTITGIAGGKAKESLIIGRDITNRNNDREVIDSDIKIKNTTGDEKIVTMEGGEIIGCKVIGERIASEGNKERIERSQIDITGNPTLGLSALFQTAGGQGSASGGDGNGGVSLKNTTITINPPTTDTTKKLEQELSHTKSQLGDQKETVDTRTKDEETLSLQKRVQHLERRCDFLMDPSRQLLRDLKETVERMEKLEQELSYAKQELKEKGGDNKRMENSPREINSFSDAAADGFAATQRAAAATGGAVAVALTSPVAVGAAAVSAVAYGIKSLFS